jgi:hypothetical protein
MQIPEDVIQKLKEGYYLIINDDKNITAWRFKDNQLENKIKHKSGITEWLAIKYLVLPMEAKYSFKKTE